MATPADPRTFVTLTLKGDLEGSFEKKMTSLFDLRAVDQILAIVQGMTATLSEHSTTLTQLLEKETAMAQVLVDLQTQESRMEDILHRAVDVITQLQAGHTVSDAEVKAVTDAMKAAADAFEAAVPAPAPGPTPGP